MIPRMVAWVFLMGLALMLGLGLNGTTLFWVGILSAWVLTRRSD